ncbi:hypothetical protein K1719_046762 [Acacia pycnantha]|nr:hypothetical protein K1719_046762 [Acacia pycnantha]
MPITSLVKCTYSRLVRYWFNRGTKAQKDAMNKMHFSSVIGEAMRNNGEQATSMRVREFNVARTTFEVDDQGDTYSENLSQGKCQCGKFQAFKFPCIHPIGSEQGIPTASEPKIIPDESKLCAKGRLKSTDIHNEMDEVEVQPSSSQTRCGICKQFGHNKRSCPKKRIAN